MVFYREPVSGEHIELDEQNFPRDKLRDKLAAIMPATMIDSGLSAAQHRHAGHLAHIDIRTSIATPAPFVLRQLR